MLVKLTIDFFSQDGLNDGRKEEMMRNCFGCEEERVGGRRRRGKSVEECPVYVCVQTEVKVFF
jgi:hypothetical protein